MHVLLIDNEQHQSSELKKAIIHFGYSVVSAASLDQAMDQLADDQRIDMVVANQLIFIRDDLHAFTQGINSIRRNRQYLYLLIFAPAENVAVKTFIPPDIADDIVKLESGYDCLRPRMDLAKRIITLENELNQKYKAIKRSYYQTIDSFEKLISNYDETLGKHCQRVGRLALMIAKRHREIKAMDYPLIEAAGRLHDIGFIGLSTSLIGKDRVEMTGDEIALYRNHPDRGYHILSRVDLLKPVAGIIKQHHEQYNGRGFPDALKIEKISMAAQVVNAASTYDHIVNIKQKSAGAVVELFQQLRGYQLSPYLVDIILEIHLTEVQRIEKQYDKLIGLEQLKDGMVLSRDVLMKSGAFCMAAGNKLDSSAIGKLKHYFELGNINDEVFICK